MAEKLNTLHDLFVKELKDIYSAEHQIIGALPQMIEAASSLQVKQGFQRHLQETRRQAERLEDIFEMLDIDPEEDFCDGIAGIIREGEKLIRLDANPEVRDAGLISAAQKVEHYEIASYGTLRTFAQTMRYYYIADKLETTLKEEFQTDELLTTVAEHSINVSASRL